MALQIYDDALEELGDDREAAWLASAAFIAALERVPSTREESREDSRPREQVT